MAGASHPDPNFDARPLSPHLSIWRWHVTMAVSILHRVTGSALYVGAILFAGWLASVAAGPEVYAPVAALLSSPLGQLGLYALVGALAFHLANGVRHLVLDTGRGMNPSDADSSAWFSILFAFAAPVGLWALVSFGR
jgi:succinate dehydrogenase / fumarate reductase cytochrome b subunit